MTPTQRGFDIDNAGLHTRIVAVLETLREIADIPVRPLFSGAEPFLGTCFPLHSFAAKLKHAQAGIYAPWFLREQPCLHPKYGKSQ
jgi:hypothetical protein